MEALLRMADTREKLLTFKMTGSSHMHSMNTTWTETMLASTSSRSFSLLHVQVLG